MTEITQADKARFRGWYRSTSTRGLDWWFARHREQAEQETVAKIVAWLRGNCMSGKWRILASEIEEGAWK